MLRDIDLIIRQLTVDIRGIRIEQLRVKHPGADDDGLWFISLQDRTEEAQIEFSEGRRPFLIESDFNNQLLYGPTVEEVVAKTKQLYSLA